MDDLKIKNTIEKKYYLNVDHIEKVKGTFKVWANGNIYSLKVVRYNFQHFLFILRAIQHLQQNGFESIPEIILGRDGREFLGLDGQYAYLTPWIDARQSNYDNPIDVQNAAVKLAQLHKKSMGFELSEDMEPRIGWFKWIENFQIRKNEIYDFYLRIQAKEIRTEFDNFYISMMEQEVDRAEKAIENLLNSEYVFKMTKEIGKKGFCHHDYAHHNVLIRGTNEVYIIDFDYCMLDTHLHDLGSLLIRRMKNGKWELRNAKDILDAYSSVYKVELDDIPIIAAFMEFPQDYWQIGIQYYWENQPWGEEFFINKLERVRADREEKQEFIEEFRGFRYKNG